MLDTVCSSSRLLTSRSRLFENALPWAGVPDGVPEWAAMSSEEVGTTYRGLHNYQHFGGFLIASIV